MQLSSKAFALVKVQHCLSVVHRVTFALERLEVVKEPKYRPIVYLDWVACPCMQVRSLHYSAAA
jgi:hypothetical protein